MHGRFKARMAEADVDDSRAPAESSAERLDLWRLWAIFLRRWWIVASSAGAVIVLVVLWLAQATPLYTATTQILLDPRKQKTFPGEAVISDLQLTGASISTEIGLMTSFAVSERVVASLDLANHPQFGGRDANAGFWGGLLKMVGMGASAKAPTPADGPAGIDPKKLWLVDAVQSGASVRRVALTYFIDISYTHWDPKTAAAIANGIAESYLNEQLEARFQAAKRAADWLSGRVVALREQLETAEQAVANHRAKFNLVSPQAGSLSEQQAADINGKLVVARAEAVEKRTRYEQASKLADGDAKIESVPAVMQSPVVAALRQQEADIARQEAEALTRYGPEHPSVVKIRAERRDLKRAMNVEVGRIVENLKKDWELSLSREKSLDASLRELTNQTTRNDEPVIRLRELERNVQANRTLYESLLARFKEAETQQNLQTQESRIVAPAFLPTSPSFPNTTRSLIIALIAGLGLGLGFAGLLEYLESGFSTVEQVEDALHLPVLALVPRLSDAQRKFDGQTFTFAQMVASKPMSRFSESIRSARVSAEMSNIDDPPKIILVASSVPGEGKTTIALTVACSGAVAGKRVLLIDCDLRHPSSTRHFNLANGPGLTDLLSGQAPAEKAIYKTPHPLLTVIPSGAATRHPPDILGSDRMRQFLHGMRESYDMIIVDSPPLSPVIDGVLLSRIVDKVLFVVSWRSTPRHVVARAIASVHESRHRVAGVVLNNAQLAHMGRYTQYYNYYNKDYKKYYVE